MSEENISGVQNSLRLHILLRKYGETTLQTLFLGRYKDLTSRKWESESLASKLSFLNQLCGGLSLGRKQKAIVQTGDICQWDITVLAKLVLEIKANENATKKLAEENSAIKELRRLRNELAHMSGKPMSPTEFTTFWKMAQDVLVYFGISENDIEHIRVTSKLDGIEFNNSFVNPENMARSKSLRGEGNAALQLNRATDAIKIYDKALLLSGLSKAERATLHSNRSQASLKVLQEGGQSIDEAHETAERALEDAKMTIEFRPLWWKGYCRAGQVHKYRKEFNDAIQWFEYAMSLEPGQPSLKDARDECRNDLRRVEIEEHLDPLLNYVNREEVTTHTAKTRGLGSTYHEKDETKSTMEMMEHLKKSDVPEIKGHARNYLAHQYKLGDNAPLNKQMAFSLFKQAADVGSPEGIYNVGLMYMRGEGVDRDVQMSLRYFERVAKCPWSKDGDLLKNLGVAEGKFMIGKCYEDGVGYEKSYTKAAEWYQKASLEGLGNASNNLAMLYRHGRGVEQSVARAMQYWRLAVEQSCPIAMYNLSRAYLKFGDLEKAETWSSRSVDSGYMPSLVEQRQFQEEVQKRRQELNHLRETFPIRIGQSQVPTYKLLKRMETKNMSEMFERALRFDNLLEDSPEEIEERRKLQWTNPKRVIIFRDHRHSVKSTARMAHYRDLGTHQAVHVQRAPKGKAVLKEISFDQMDPTKDHVYEGHVISLTIMEDSIFKAFPSVHSVVKDLNDDFQRIYFYSFNCDDPKVVKNLRYGSRIRVKNPYFRMTADGGVGIRVDDPSSVVFVSAGDESSLCRFCGKEDAQSHCSQCLRVKYCSKECQVQDWKLLKHKDICSLKSLDCL